MYNKYLVADQGWLGYTTQDDILLRRLCTSCVCLISWKTQYYMGMICLLEIKTAVYILQVAYPAHPESDHRHLLLQTIWASSSLSSASDSVIC